MPAHRKHPSPSEQVVELLAARRREGLPFDEAWERTVGQATKEGATFGGDVRFPHKTCERRGWRQALEETKEEWLAAYDLVDTPLSLALGRALSLVLDGDEAAVQAVPAGTAPMRLTFVPPVSGASLSRVRHKAAA